MCDLREIANHLADTATAQHYNAAQTELHWRQMARGQGSWPGVENELQRMRAQADAVWAAYKIIKVLVRHPWLAWLVTKDGEDGAASGLRQ